MAIPAQILKDEIYQKSRGYKNYTWELSATVPAGSTIWTSVKIPTKWVYLESGYEFDPDTLGVLEFSHYHDGEKMMEDITLDEGMLSFRYSKRELTQNQFVVKLKNTDTANDHSLHMYALYWKVPQEDYVRVEKEVTVGA